MKMNYGGLLFLSTNIFVCVVQVFSNQNVNADLEDSKALLYDTLNALTKAMEFFEKEHKHINLDAAIGTRLVDGTLKVLLHHINYDLESWPLDDATLEKIRALQKLAEDVSDKSLPYIQHTDPSYYSRLGPVIQKDFWTLDFASKDFSPEDLYGAWLPQPGEALREQESDNCITEILGTGPNTKAKCHISSECWQKMTQPGYSSYSLTHQTFYLMIAYRMGCGEEMNKQRTLLGQPPPSELVDRFCASTYLEAKQIEQDDFPNLKQDLFMEQAALCGVMGYRWFFTSDWLEKIIGWQDTETGCFKGDTILETDVEMRKQTSNQNYSSSRVKREERLLDNGCLCHRTTVAASALAAYVRYIAEYEQMIFQRNQLLN